MTVTSSTRKVVHYGNGTFNPWPINFKFFLDEHIQLRRKTTSETTWTVIPPSDYTLSGAGNAEGGTLTYPLTGDALTSTDMLEITRNVPYTQTGVKLNNSSGFSPALIERELDLAVMRDQQLSITNFPEPEGGKLLGWNDAGNALVNRVNDGSASTVVVTGGVATRNLADKLSDNLTILDFTDDPSAVTDWAPVAAAMAAANNGVVVMPAGDYPWLTQLLVVNANLVILGEPGGLTRILAGGTPTTYKIFFDDQQTTADSIKRFIMRDITFVADSANNNGMRLRWRPSGTDQNTVCDIDNVEFITAINTAAQSWNRCILIEHATQLRIGEISARNQIGTPTGVLLELSGFILTANIWRVNGSYFSNLVLLQKFPVVKLGVTSSDIEYAEIVAQPGGIIGITLRNDVSGELIVYVTSGTFTTGALTGANGNSATVNTVTNTFYSMEGLRLQNGNAIGCQRHISADFNGTEKPMYYLDLGSWHGNISVEHAYIRNVQQVWIEKQNIYSLAMNAVGVNIEDCSEVFLDGNTVLGADAATGTVAFKFRGAIAQLNMRGNIAKNLATGYDWGTNVISRGIIANNLSVTTDTPETGSFSTVGENADGVLAGMNNFDGAFSRELGVSQRLLMLVNTSDDLEFVMNNQDRRLVNTLAAGGLYTEYDETLDAPIRTITAAGVVNHRLQATATPIANGDMTVERTSNTTLTFKLKGTDGTVRSGTITLS